MNVPVKSPLIVTLVVTVAALGLWVTPAEGKSTDEYGYTTIECYECDSKTDDQCLLEKTPSNTTSCKDKMPGPTSCVTWTINGTTDATAQFNQGYKGCLGRLHDCFRRYAEFRPEAGKCLKRRMTQEAHDEFTKCQITGPPSDSRGRSDQKKDSDKGTEDIEIAICSCQDKDLCNDQDLGDLQSAEWASKWAPQPSGSWMDRTESETPTKTKTATSSASKGGRIGTFLFLMGSLMTVNIYAKPSLILTLLVVVSAFGLLVTPAEGKSTTIECYKCDSKTDDQCLEKNPNSTTSCNGGLPEPTSCAAWIINGTTDATSKFNQGSKDCLGNLKYCSIWYVQFEPVAGKCVKRRMAEEAYDEFIMCLKHGPPQNGNAKGNQGRDSGSVGTTTDAGPEGGTGDIEIAICSCQYQDLCNDQDLGDLKSAEWAPKWVPEPGGCGMDGCESKATFTMSWAAKGGRIWTFLLLIVSNCARLQLQY